MECKYIIRYSEYDSIETIFNFINGNSNTEQYLNNLNSYKERIDIANKETTLESWIYKIRNTCVHLSFNKEKDIDIKTMLSDDTIVKT